MQLKAKITNNPVTDRDEILKIHAERQKNEQLFWSEFQRKYGFSKKQDVHSCGFAFNKMADALGFWWAMRATNWILQIIVMGLFLPFFDERIQYITDPLPWKPTAEHQKLISECRKELNDGRAIRVPKMFIKKGQNRFALIKVTMVRKKSEC